MKRTLGNCVTGFYRHLTYFRTRKWKWNRKIGQSRRNDHKIRLFYWVLLGFYWRLVKKARRYESNTNDGRGSNRIRTDRWNSTQHSTRSRWNGDENIVTTFPFLFGFRAGPAHGANVKSWTMRPVFTAILPRPHFYCRRPVLQQPHQSWTNRQHPFKPYQAQWNPVKLS